jgi:hypothetical protein
LVNGIRELFETIHGRRFFSRVSFRAALQPGKKTIIDATTTNVPSLLDKNGKE